MKKQSVKLKEKEKKMNKALGIFVGIGLFFTAGCFDKGLTPDEASAKKFATIFCILTKNNIRIF